MNVILRSEIFNKWFAKLKDKMAVALITRRLDRIKLGNFGDHKFLGGGIYEMRIDTGKGYRIYYAREGEITYLLICGGDKTSQQHDIDLAKQLWAEYKQGEH
ncbi:type II toxin-antitoxin system RelE/ParE family toxin [Testudinibacter sp. P27/CKL/0425]